MGKTAVRPAPSGPPQADVSSPLTVLKGIGPRRAALLEAAFGVRTVGELLRIPPRRYQPPPRDATADGLQDGERVRIAVAVRGVTLWRRGRRSLLRVRLEDEAGRLEALFFNQPWMKTNFPAGRKVVLEGRVSLKKGPVLLSPRVVDAGRKAGRGLVPVYPCPEGVSPGLLPRALEAAFALHLEIPELLPPALLRLAGVPELSKALHDLHHPPDAASSRDAARRLAWGEVLALEARRRRRRFPASPLRARDQHIWKRIRARIPFEFTPDQEHALACLRADLHSGKPMRRLLHGEVGSGKTAVAFALSLAVAAEGGQAALLAPTEILARQHLRTFRHWLRGSQLKVDGLLGDDAAAERREVLKRLSRGETRVAIGTHALFGPAVRFADLALVVFDEQHRFGVRQKGTLVAKGRSPHVLTMTATPIPRTLAWARYGALQPLELRARPGGAGRVRTCVASMQEWPRLARQAGAAFRQGERAFVVVPRIDGPDGLLVRARALLRGPWKGIPAGLVCGRLPGAEVQAVVEAFARRELRILFGTTVVEVGLDVPAVPRMFVLDAHRLGLASLHQLRGRLARGPEAGEGECWLLGQGEGLARLRLLESCTDGFAVAAADLRERGPGALRGLRQHGRTGFSFFDPVRDQDLVEALSSAQVGRFLAPPGD